jgi:hypothetical protein
MRVSAAFLFAAVVLASGSAAAEERKPALYLAPEGTTYTPWTGQGPQRGTISNIIYLNRCTGGCQIRKAARNNSQTDESWIPNGNDGQVFTLSEFSHSDETWDAIVACVADMYSAYDVLVTDVEPTGQAHTEVFAAGLDSQIGISGAGGIGGVVQPGADGCEPAENNVSFAFLNGYSASAVEYMCGVIAQESGHSFAMPFHVRDCSDPMSYSYNGPCNGNALPRGYFRNREMKCGDAGVEPTCNCGGPRINTHQILINAFGAGATPEAPTAAIISPQPGGAVTDNTLFQVAGSGGRGVYRVELYLNDWRWGVYEAPEDLEPGTGWPPPNFVVDPENGIPNGVIDAKAIVYDDLGTSRESAVITLIKGSPCGDAGDCADGQSCSEGRCSWEQPVGELGDECEYDQYCIGPEVYDGKCVSDSSGQSLCTRDCFTGPNDDCEDGFYCLETNANQGTGVCWPDSGDTGCCSTGRQSRSQTLWSIAFAALVGLIAIRRRGRR